MLARPGAVLDYSRQAWQRRSSCKKARFAWPMPMPGKKQGKRQGKKQGEKKDEKLDEKKGGRSRPSLRVAERQLSFCFSSSVSCAGLALPLVAFIAWPISFSSCSLLAPAGTLTVPLAIA